MVDYRGVDKKDVIESLTRAEKFIRSLNMGPHTEKLLDRWKDTAPLATLQAAADRKSFAQAMTETGSESIFRRMRDVFNYHAAADKSGQALKTYQDVARWGGFNGMELADYRGTDQEEHVHLVLQYADRCAHMGFADYIEAHAKMNEIVSEFSQNNEDNDYGHLPVLAQRMIDLVAMGDEAKATKLFLRNDLHMRYVLMNCLEHASGSAEAKRNISAPGPFKRYGITVNNLPSSFKEMADILKPLSGPMEAALADFYDTGEVMMTAIGVITEDRKQSGLVFVATKAAAEAVARKMPDCTVIDSAGRRISPPGCKKNPQPPMP